MQTVWAEQGSRPLWRFGTVPIALRHAPPSRWWVWDPRWAGVVRRWGGGPISLSHHQKRPFIRRSSDEKPFAHDEVDRWRVLRHGLPRRTRCELVHNFVAGPCSGRCCEKCTANSHLLRQSGTCWPCHRFPWPCVLPSAGCLLCDTIATVGTREISAARLSTHLMYRQF